MKKCAKCGTKGAKGNHLTRHHILPRRWFESELTVVLCRKCHDKLELLIPFPKQDTAFYHEVLSHFLGGGQDEDS